MLQNVAPVQLTPLYSLPDAGGVEPNHYWPDKPSNLTAVSYQMLEQVVTVNAMYKYRISFAVGIERRFPGAHFALMDTYGVVSRLDQPVHNGDLICACSSTTFTTIRRST